MSRKLPAAVGLVLLVVAAGLVALLRRAEPLNVVLVVIDTVRADHVGCYGYERPTTPHLDRLARNGILFRHAYSAAPWTLPSIASLLTGQYPSVLGVRDRPVVLDDRFPMLAELLAENGYATQGIVSNTLVGRELGFGRGFGGFDQASERRSHARVTSPEVTRKAIDFLDEREDRPFFLFVHYFDPHYNFILDPQHDYYPSYGGELKSNQWWVDLWRIRHRLSDDDIRYLVALYDSEISLNDGELGKLLDELEKRDLYDNTVIVVTSDHGEEFMERGWIGHCTSLYEELMHVPLVMRFPGRPPQVVDTPVALLDVVPTLLDVLGLTPPDDLEGQAFRITPRVSVEARPIFGETFNYRLLQRELANLNIDRPKRAEVMALRSVLLGRRKLIFNEVNGSEQVYDLSEDPHERHNLSDRRSSEDQELEKLLFRWIDYVNEKRRLGPAQDALELLTPEQRKQLESMGYL